MNKPDFTEQELALLRQKKKFLIQDDMFEEIKLLRDSHIALLIYSIFEYVESGMLPELEEEHHIPIKMSFNRFKKQHDENCREWLDSRKKKQEAGRLGGIARSKASMKLQKPSTA